MEKSFNKHYLKKDHGTGRVVIEDGKPVIGDLIKADCRLEQRHADVLNKGWKRSGVYYVSSKEQDEANQKAEDDRKAESEAIKSKEDKFLSMKNEIERLKAELKAKPEVIKSESRLKLESQAKKLDVSFRSDISDDKLIERINEKKN
jgi:hypothetical protein